MQNDIDIIATKDEMKIEALKRIKKLGFIDDVYDLFKNHNGLYYSERQNRIFPATLYWLSNDENYVKIVKDFEDRTGHLVYHAILTNTTFGHILDLLFISKYKEDWTYDMEKYSYDGDEGYRVMSMANNLDDEMLSDMGSIIIRPVMGGVERIG